MIQSDDLFFNFVEIRGTNYLDGHLLIREKYIAAFGEIPEVSIQIVHRQNPPDLGKIDKKPHSCSRLPNFASFWSQKLIFSDFFVRMLKRSKMHSFVHILKIGRVPISYPRVTGQRFSLLIFIIGFTHIPYINNNSEKRYPITFGYEIGTLLIFKMCTKECIFERFSI